IVSLEEKLGHKRQEQASTGTNSSEAINYRVRMSELDGFNGYLDKYFNTFLEKLKLGFEKRTNEITEDFSSNVKEIEEQVKQQNEKKQKNGTILENTKFIFANVVFVLIAIVLTRALFYGLWEGFNVK